MNSILRNSFELPALAMVWLAVAGCRPAPPSAAEQGLPPAYTRNQITDPALRQVAEEIQGWAAKQVGAGGQPLFSRSEVLPPAQTVQPYGVGAYQQELHLPVILTTGSGWAGLKPAEKEAAAVRTFSDIAGRLQALKREPQLQPTLTIQTPQGMELAWINHLDPSGKYVHGDD
jgi:hypothetical protein